LGCYFNDALIDPNFELSLLPRPSTTATIASAISPYSIAY